MIVFKSVMLTAPCEQVRSFVYVLCFATMHFVRGTIPRSQSKLKFKVNKQSTGGFDCEREVNNYFDMFAVKFVNNGARLYKSRLI